MDQKTLAYYQKHAEEYIEKTKTAFAKEKYAAFLSQLPEQGKILDLGCGSARDSLYFASLGYAVLPLDNCEEFVQHAKELGFKDAVLGDIENLSFENEFDGVWACASLLHIKKENLSKVFNSIYRSLKEGGIFYCSFKMGSKEGHDEEGRYYTYLTKNDLYELYAESEFSTIELTTSSDSLNRKCVWLECVFRK